VSQRLVSQILGWRCVGDNEAELHVQWTNTNTPEWVVGSQLANSEQVSEEMLQEFLDANV